MYYEIACNVILLSLSLNNSFDRILKRDFEVVWCWFGLRVVLLPDNNNTNNLSLLSGYATLSRTHWA